MNRHRSLRHGLTAVAAVALAAITLAAPPAAAQGTTSFQIQVPRKVAAGQLPVSRVKLVVSLVDESPVRFELTPPDGDVLTLPTSGTLTPGSATCTTTPAACIVEFCTGGDCSPLPGTVARDLAWIEPPPPGLPAGDPQRRRYVLYLDLLSDYDPVSFCANTMPVANETWTVTVDTGPNVTGACPLSFDAGCPGTECTPGCLNDPALVAAAEPVASIPGTTGGTQACGEERPAVDSMLVLDKSGSMSGSTLGGAPTSKIDALHSAVTELTDVWEALRAAEGAGAPAGDQIGLVLFDSNAHDMDEVGVAGWAGVADGLNGFDGVKNDIRDHIGSLGAGGSTSLGDGLISASGHLFAGANAGNGHRKVILVMSNGKENTNARVKVDNPANPAVVQTYPTGDPTDTTQLPNQANLRIYSVTVGTSTAVSADINEDIATATGGFYINSEDDADLLGPFFLELLQNFTQFNTNETLRLISAETAAGSPFTTRFPTPSSQTSVVFSLRWQPEHAALRLTVTPPGGSPVSQTSVDGSILMSPTLPLPPPKGEWLVEVELADPVIDSAVASPIPFHLTMIGDDRAMRSDFRAVPADYEPGDDIRLEARLSRFGRPLTGLGEDPTATVEARLVKPGSGLGDVLSASDAPADQPTPADPLTAADAKLANELAANPDALDRDTDVVTLFDDGAPAHGDQRAGDGIYSGLYPAVLPGHYNFLFSVESGDPESGPFSRQQLKTVHVRTVPDGEQTEVTTVATADVLRVGITPRTRFGNLVGPGFGPFLFVVPQGTGQPPAAVAVRPTDNLDGTYTALVPYTGEPPQVDVHFVRTSTNLDDSVPPDKLPEPLGDGTVLVGGSGAATGWSLSLHYGGNDPDGGELTGCDGDTGWGIDLENRFSRRWAGEAFAGWDDFDCPGGEIEANHVGVNLKRYLTSGTWEPFVLGGIGGYSLSSSGSDPGYSLGVGVLFHALPKLGVEATAKRHWVTTSPTTEYTTYQVGLRFGL